MNIFVWVLQIALALVFLGAGLTKLSQPKDKLQSTMGWVEDFPGVGVKTIGALEVLGAIGLVLPWWTGIASVLTPLAALGLAAIMLGAIVTHVRRKEVPFAVANIVLGGLALFVAIQRF